MYVVLGENLTCTESAIHKFVHLLKVIDCHSYHSDQHHGKKEGGEIFFDNIKIQYLQHSSETCSDYSKLLLHPFRIIILQYRLPGFPDKLGKEGEILNTCNLESQYFTHFK